MPRPALTDEQRRATRRKIRDAAATLHAENGLGNISARAVAELAGVSVGTLYSHFGNLSELMQSLWRQPARRLVNDLGQVAGAHEDPLARLQALLETYVGFSLDNPGVFRGAFLFVRPESHAAPPQVALDDDVFFRTFRDAVRDGQRTGQFRTGNADELTQQVLSAVHGAIALPVNLHRLALDATPDMPHKMIATMLEWLQAN